MRIYRDLDVLIEEHFSSVLHKKSENIQNCLAMQVKAEKEALGASQNLTLEQVQKHVDKYYNRLKNTFNESEKETTEAMTDNFIKAVNRDWPLGAEVNYGKIIMVAFADEENTIAVLFDTEIEPIEFEYQEKTDFFVEL